MINRRIIISAISIVSALTITGAATFAAFTDTAKSTGNNFTTGNADLLIGNDLTGAPSGYADNIAGVSLSGLFPGSTTSKLFWLKNHSTSVGMSFATTVDLTGNTGDSILADNVFVQFVCDTDNNGLGTGNSSTAEKTVTQWVTDPVVALATIGPNQGASNASGAFSDLDELLCRMDARVNSGAGDSIQGKTISFDSQFDATQTP